MLLKLILSDSFYLIKMTIRKPKIIHITCIIFLLDSTGLAKLSYGD